MKRRVMDWLDGWLPDPERRPLMLRGARQVGKTWLVRDLAFRSGRDLVELNFEREPGLRRHFASNNPHRVLDEIALSLGRDILPAQSILFLDEIQAAGELIAKLRWFYEEMRELAVVTAGSLLEFTFSDHSFSMPVGRISFGQVDPMDFAEYLQAHGQEALHARLASWRPGTNLSGAAHEKATEWFHRYAMVGGMPAIVSADVMGRDPRVIRELQRDLAVAYRADFAKYAGRMDRDILDSVLSAVARSVGQKFVYARVGDGVKQHQAKRALELLATATLCHIVRHSAANGIPLGGEAKDRSRKVVLVDVGLLHGLIGTPAGRIFPSWPSLSASLRGQISGQILAQQLRTVSTQVGSGPEIFYWQREGGQPGEIDYLVQINGRIMPVELKSGAAGAMKSLHQFMLEKRLDLAARIDANPPSMMDVAVKTTLGQPVTYRLLNIPPYLVWNLELLLGDILAGSPA